MGGVGRAAIVSVSKRRKEKKKMNMRHNGHKIGLQSSEEKHVRITQCSQTNDDGVKSSTAATGLGNIKF